MWFEALQLRYLGLLLIALIWPRVAQGKDAFGPSTTNLAPVQDSLTQSRGNGVYGRFNGPWAPQISLLYEYQTKGKLNRIGVEGSLLYLQSVGPYLRGRFAPTGTSLRYSPLLSAGIELQPLFLLRWQQGKEVGPAVVDLMLDSLSFQAGLAVKFPEMENAALRGGAELGLGAGVPLMGSAEGLWLRAHTALLTGQRLSALFGLKLQWQFFVGDPSN